MSSVGSSRLVDTLPEMADPVDLCVNFHERAPRQAAVSQVGQRYSPSAAAESGGLS